MTLHRLAMCALSVCAFASACAAPAPADPEPQYVVSAPADPSDELFATENLIRLDLELPLDSL